MPHTAFCTVAVPDFAALNVLPLRRRRGLAKRACHAAPGLCSRHQDVWKLEGCVRAVLAVPGTFPLLDTPCTVCESASSVSDFFFSSFLLSVWIKMYNRGDDGIGGAMATSKVRHRTCLELATEWIRGVAGKVDSVQLDEGCLGSQEPNLIMKINSD